jgi:surface protein
MLCSTGFIGRGCRLVADIRMRDWRALAMLAVLVLVEVGAESDADPPSVGVALPLGQSALPAAERHRRLQSLTSLQRLERNVADTREALDLLRRFDDEAGDVDGEVDDASAPDWAQLLAHAESSLASLETETLLYVTGARRALFGADVEPRAIAGSAELRANRPARGASSAERPSEVRVNRADTSAAVHPLFAPGAPAARADRASSARRLLQSPVAALTDANVRLAVSGWISSPSTVAATYGPVSGWDVSRVSNMHQLFYQQRTFNDDLSGWNTASVTTMFGLFDASRTVLGAAFAGDSAFAGDLAAWNVASVSNLSRMFYTAKAFNADISKWNTARVTNAAKVFQQALAFNRDIGGWNVASLTSMASGFWAASDFNHNLASWNVVRVSNFASAFDSTAALADCHKRSMHNLWGSTLQAAYPTWSSFPATSRNLRQLFRSVSPRFPVCIGVWPLRHFSRASFDALARHATRRVHLCRKFHCHPGSGQLDWQLDRHADCNRLAKQSVATGPNRYEHSDGRSRLDRQPCRHDCRVWPHLELGHQPRVELLQALRIGR